MKTLVKTTVDAADRKWYIIDAKGQRLGRISTTIAELLKGKRNVDFTPHIDNGHHVVVINIDKIEVTGRKELQKNYYSHSGYMGHLKVTPLERLKKKKPYEPLRLAVRGMLPKNKHRDNMLARLKQYIGENHEHAAQKPEKVTL